MPNTAGLRQRAIGGNASAAAARTAFILILLGLIAVKAVPALAADELMGRVLEVETYAAGHPERALAVLAPIASRANAEPTAEPRFAIDLLRAKALVAAGRNAEALALAARLETDPGVRALPLASASALLVRSEVQATAGDSALANSLAKQARELLKGSADPFLTHQALMAIGTTARGLGQRDEALDTLQEVLSLAEQAGNPYRRSSALYQLSVLYYALKQGDKALAASLDAFKFGEAAGSRYAMVNARMAESAALELLERPERELEAMTEALSIARADRSQISECRALINLSDIRLRRRDFRDAMDLSRRSLDIAKTFGDPGLVATSEANLGFALFGLGRTQEGKRFTEEALAEYERSGATAEIASLLGEYGQYLERAGEFKAALALYHREQKLNDEIALASHQRTVLEMQEKYEAEKRQREIELLNRENEVNSAELRARVLQERVWWLLAAVFAVSFVVVAALYRKLRTTNRLLGQKNQELSFQSSRDPLTTLYNRRYFQDFIGDRSAQAERRRGDGRTIQALLLIDLDHFKETNDRYGHAAGDAVLVAVARRLRDTLRETDMIVRWGGEEFLVFVPATHAETLDEIATRIMHAVACAPFLYEGAEIAITASVGFVPMPLPPHDVPLPWERAIGLADMALYMAKIHGRNCAYGIHGITPADPGTLETVERDLERAWRDGKVDLHVLSGANALGDTYSAIEAAALAR
jgi:diguanylate cyclase (GGDEF)-like protein